MKAREKLEKWVEQNPDGYLEMSFRNIADKASVSHSTVDRNLLKIIAKRDGLIVSQVKFKREQAGFIQKKKGDQMLSDEQIKQIWELFNQKYDVDDIAYIVDVDVRTVKKYLSK